MAFQDLQPGDIRATLAVSQEEARFGSSRVINLPGGRTTTVIVPAGTRDGEEIRLPGQGSAGAAGGMPGDLVLRVSVITTDRFKSTPGDNLATQAVQNPFSPPPPNLQAQGGQIGHTVPAYPQPPAGAFAAAQTDVAGGGYSPPVQPQAPGGPQSYPGFTSYPNQPAYGQVAQSEQTYPPQYYQPQQPQRRRGGAVTAIILVMVLLLLVGSGLFFYVGYYRPNQEHSAATQTAQSQAVGTANAQLTGTAQVIHATANAQASSTAQAQATAQAYQTIYNQATGGTPTLNDPLNSQTGNRWDEFNGGSSNGSCAFSGGSYHSSTPNAGFFQPCYAEGTNFSNFAFQVDMTISHGDQGGIIFRADSANDKFYLFRIGVDGSYDLYLYVNNQGSQAQRLLTGSTGLMKGLGQSNKITLVARNTNLYFYLNGEYLNGTSDNTYASGKIGVFGESSSQATDVAFSNAKVWTL